MMQAQGALGRLHAVARQGAASIKSSQRLYITQQRLPIFACSRRRGFHSTPNLQEENQVPSETNSGPVNGVKTSVDQEDSGVAFAFDIDGVLYRGGDPIEGAAQALRMLKRKGYRYVFLTNGGGVAEKAKATALEKKLGLGSWENVVGQRVIQSHTPKKGWPEHVKQNDTVLITGQQPHWVRRIAKSYGFKNVVTPIDIEAAHDHIYPFLSPRALQNPNGATVARNWNVWKPLPKGKEIFNPQDPYTTDIPKSALKIDHIFVWNDPRDWSVDIQLIHDVLASHKGYVGTVSRKNGDKNLPNNGWQQDDQPCLWISNLDLHWKTQYPINRFGTGAFVEALKGVWRAATDGVELQYKALGKPLQVTYEYAHDKLLHMEASGAESKKPKSLKRVYMIGDNPESDISGANKFSPADGAEWKSVLVRTGVWGPTTMEPEPRHKPDVIVNDVVDAIVWALNSEGVKMSREELLALGTAESSEEETLAEKAKETVTMPSAPIGRIVA